MTKEQDKKSILIAMAICLATMRLYHQYCEKE